jgi:hypothetical protein
LKVTKTTERKKYGRIEIEEIKKKENQEVKAEEILVGVKERNWSIRT